MCYQCGVPIWFTWVPQYILCLNLQKTHSAKEKSKKTPNTQRQKGFDEKQIYITKENTEINKSLNQRKCTKLDQRNLKQVKKFNKYRNNYKRNHSYCRYEETPEILLQVRKTQLNTEKNLSI